MDEIKKIYNFMDSNPLWEHYFTKARRPYTTIYNPQKIFEGSGFFLKYNTSLFLITANHVIHDYPNIYIPEIIPTGKDEEMIGEFVEYSITESNTVRNIDLDIAVIALDKVPYQNISPAKLSQIIVDVNKDMDGAQLLGLTDSTYKKTMKKSKYLSEDLSNEEIKKSKMMIMFNHQCNVIDFDENYVYLNYENKIPLLTKDGLGAKSQTPRLEGLSGSAAWLLDDNMGKGLPRILGIISSGSYIKHNIKLVRCNKIIPMIDQLLNNIS